MTNSNITRMPNTGGGYDYPVPLHRLSIGARFACYTQLDGVWGLPDRLEFGTLLWVGTGSCEVWYDHLAKPDRVTPELEVYCLDDEPFTEEQLAVYGLPIPNTEDPSAMSDVQSAPTSPAVKALVARYNFQLKALEEALDVDDKAKAAISMTRLEKAVREAHQLHVQLPDPPEKLQTYEPLLELLTAEQDKAKAAHAEAETRRVQNNANAQKHADRAVAVEKHKNEVGAAKKEKAPPKPKAEKKQRPCLDGCGQMVSGNFAMGHDAKLKSLLLKIERGDEPLDKIPEPCLDLVKIVKGDPIQERDSEGKPKGEPKKTFRIVAAPVRFPGRDDITLTHRED